MKSKWLKNQIKRWEYMRPRTKREITESQTGVIMILFVVVILLVVIRKVMM